MSSSNILLADKKSSQNVAFTNVIIEKNQNTGDKS